MTLNEILTNEELRRHEFPVACDKIFLGHAGVCPLPHRVADAISACAAQGTLGDQEAFMLHRLGRRTEACGVSDELPEGRESRSMGRPRWA